MLPSRNVVYILSCFFKLALTSKYFVFLGDVSFSYMITTSSWRSGVWERSLSLKIDTRFTKVDPYS